MEKNKNSKVFNRISTVITNAAGSSSAFGIVPFIIVVWTAGGFLFHFSGTWLPVINTGTALVAMLMIFVSQQPRNKDSPALKIELNEWKASQAQSGNRLMDIEVLTEAGINGAQKNVQRHLKLMQIKKGCPDSIL